jgi:hypothetical protein
MALANYTDLVSAIQSEGDDTSAAFVAKIPDFVAQAEAWFRREIRVDDMVATTTLTASTENTAVPSGFKGALAVDIDGTPDRAIERMGLAELKRAYPSNQTGKPYSYAIADEKFWWGPVPDSSYTVNLVYSATIPGLQANTTNWLMTAHPDLYRAGVLAYAFLWLDDGARATLNKGLADEIISAINRDSIKRTAGASPIAPRHLVAQVRGSRI